MFFLIGQNHRRRNEAPLNVPDVEQDPELEAVGSAVSLSAAPVHLVSAECRVSVRSGYIIVEAPAAAAREIPIEHISALNIHGWAHVISGSITALASAGIPVIWRSSGGYPIVQTQPLTQRGLETRRAQYRIAERPVAGLKIARVFVSAKIMNQRGLLRRRLNDAAKRDCLRLSRLALKANGAGNAAALLGFEGAAAAIYFARWKDLPGERAPDNAFNGRSRRPPEDIANAALSYLYAVLLSEAVCAVSATGLDPALGFLHQPRSGRPALALDLMEPFRPLIVDTCVLTAPNRGQISSALAQDRRLDPDQKRTLLAVYEDRLSTSWRADGEPAGMTWRARLHRSAADLAQSIVRGEPFVMVTRG